MKRSRAGDQDSSSVSLIKLLLANRKLEAAARANQAKANQGEFGNIYPNMEESPDRWSENDIEPNPPNPSSYLRPVASLIRSPNEDEDETLEGGDEMEPESPGSAFQGEPEEGPIDNSVYPLYPYSPVTLVRRGYNPRFGFGVVPGQKKKRLFAIGGGRVVIDRANGPGRPSYRLNPSKYRFRRSDPRRRVFALAPFMADQFLDDIPIPPAPPISSADSDWQDRIMD